MLPHDTSSSPWAMDDPNGSYVPVWFLVFPTVGMATYKNLKFPRRLRFKERMKIILNKGFKSIGKKWTLWFKFVPQIGKVQAISVAGAKTHIDPALVGVFTGGKKTNTNTIKRKIYSLSNYFNSSCNTPYKAWLGKMDIVYRNYLTVKYWLTNEVNTL